MIEERNIQNSLGGAGICKEERLQQDKNVELQKKYRLITVALIVVIVAVIAFWPVRGEWSEWQFDEPAKEQWIKVNTDTRYRFREKITLITETTNGIEGKLLSHWEDWSDYSDWSEWQTEPVESSEECEVEHELHYRKRSVTVDKQYTEWSEWGKWSINVPTPSDTLEAQTRDVYVYNGYKYYCQTCGKSYPSSSNPCSSHNVVYQTKIMYGLNTEIPVNTKSSPYTISYNGEKWYTSSGTFSMKAVQYQTRTRELEEVTVYGDWSEYTDKAITPSENLEVESVERYRFRTRKWVTKYEFEVWGEWNDWQSTKLEDSDAIQTEECAVYRYANKYFLWEKLFGRME